MKTSSLLFVFFICFIFNATAQPYTLTGRIIDATDTSTLIDVSVIFQGVSDTSIKTGTVSDADGNFSLGGIAAGSYSVKFNYIGYQPQTKNIVFSNGNISLGTIKMSSTSKELKTVTVAATEIRAKQLGDTSQFNANAYKSHADATAEDLVNKMPGVTSDNSGVKVNGETLQQVLVDGKPFFGSDPTLALKNLPAEVIDNIQIFDKLSDQAAFTGFDDGSSQKTMNINTKKGKSEGVFGKVYAGYGTDDRYLTGGNINIFHGEQRISILGLANNVNQQNFSSQDLLGVSSGSGNGGGGGNRGGSGGFGGSRGGSGGGNSGGGTSNFLSGQQSGISTTNSFGINYSDKWGKKLKVSGSYFFNNTDNTNSTDIARVYTDSSENIYHETTAAETKNTNHRFNLRLEYNIDSANTIFFTPSLSLQQNNSAGNTVANDSIRKKISSSTINNTAANTHGYNSTNNLLFQHKFKKQKRTISININSSLNEKTGTGSYYSNNRFYFPDTLSLYDQHYNLYNNSNTISANVTYTEPVGKKGQVAINYNPSVSKSNADKDTYDKNDVTNAYSTHDTALSNKYNNNYTTQKGGISYRLGDRKMNFMIGANVQQATLDGVQYFPYALNINKSFTSILPNAMYNYRYTDGRNLRIMYRTNTEAPSITQLQSVVDISNPLLLRTGNADLKQDYEQTFIVRYGQAKAKTGNNFFLNLFINYTDNYIGNATYLPYRGDSLYTDKLTQASVLIKKGSQLTKPVNLDGYWNARSFLTYGMPVKAIKSNLNLNGSFNFSRTPGLLNDRINYSSNYIPSVGVVLSSNISEKLDFTLSATGNYNIVKNNVQSSSNTNYYNQVSSFKINWVFLKSFVFNTNLSHNYYTAFSSTGDQNFLLWNTYIGYKLLTNNALEVRLSAFDLLNQNKSITRTVTANYIENDVTQVLKQYFLLQLTYTIRNFKGAMPEEQHRPFEGMMPPGGMRPNRDGNDGK